MIALGTFLLSGTSGFRINNDVDEVVANVGDDEAADETVSPKVSEFKVGEFEPCALLDTLTKDKFLSWLKFVGNVLLLVFVDTACCILANG